MIHLRDKPDPKYEELQNRLTKAIAYNCLITSGIGLMIFTTIVFFIITVVAVSWDMQMHDDVRELSEICNTAIEALVCDDENAGELLVEADSKVDEIKKKYSIE